MFGCEVIFDAPMKDGSAGSITAVGCIFNDGSIYLHEPVCDMWASIPDLIAERADIIGFQVIGPVIPVELVKQTMEANFKSAQAFTRKQLAGYKTTYEHDLAQLARFDEYHKKPIRFMNKTEEPEIDRNLNPSTGPCDYCDSSCGMLLLQLDGNGKRTGLGTYACHDCGMTVDYIHRELRVA